MRRKIQDAVVVITGASSGIGRAAAHEFARRGATLAITARDKPSLEKTADECREMGATVLVLPADVTDEGEVKAVARQVIEKHGRIDVWVNNAAVILFGRIEDTPYKEYRRVIETNLLGYIHGARAVIPHFREQGSGTLINVSSAYGKNAAPYLSAYSASKFGIVGLGESLRMELRDAPGVRVCTVLPATIDTALFQHAANYTGRSVRALEPIHRVEKAAKAIVRLVEHPRREVAVGCFRRPLGAMHSLAPGLAERTMSRTVEKGHFFDASAPATSGNIDRPMPEWNQVSGGWIKEGRRKPIGLIAGIAGGVAAAAVGTFFGLRALKAR